VVVRIAGPALLRGISGLLFEHENTEQKILPRAEITDRTFTASPRLRGR
jgi:hypothetical protein